MYEKIEAILCELLVIKRHVKYTQLKYEVDKRWSRQRKKGLGLGYFFSSPSQLLNKSERPPCIERSLHLVGSVGTGCWDYVSTTRSFSSGFGDDQQRGSRNFECISNAKRASHSSYSVVMCVHYPFHTEKE